MHTRFQEDRRRYLPNDEDRTRFYSNVSTGEGCWEWTGGKVRGYGKFNMGSPVRRQYPAHRVAWMLENGQIPEGMVICHRCDNPGCVRPDHLFLGTLKDNSRDMAKKKRQVFQRYPERKMVGERNGAAKLSPQDVLEIRHLYQSTRISQAALAERFGVSEAVISKVVRGLSWTNVTEGQAVSHVPCAPRKRLLTGDQVQELRRKREAGATYAQLARTFGISAPIVRKIAARETYRDVP